APHLEKLAQHLYICAPTPAQYAALVALDDTTRPVLEARREALRRRRDVFTQALSASGLILDAAPQGAFYLYADASPFTDDTQRLAADLLEQAHVACTPGIDFGEHRTQTRLRFAYTTDEARLQEAAERIARVLQRR
ncbi:MAG: aminotransferase class I/II-fold pyridoxal phosphate-dependent enzyme, partial [Rhodocyclaceae bacterium]|nr:aminotransferase class I/II-fold pyridoxal phosphate-dependent enzyme [Rhodocyclaceae bacterium]